MKLPMKLYCISEGNPETDLYVVSTYTEEKDIRSFYHINDHGGMPWEDYERVATTGKITEITSLSQVPEDIRRLFLLVLMSGLKILMIIWILTTTKLLTLYRNNNETNNMALIRKTWKTK
jgi:hypothetical protein